MNCRGTEDNLFECNYRGKEDPTKGIHNCRQKERAGVKCMGKLIAKCHSLQMHSLHFIVQNLLITIIASDKFAFFTSLV